MFDTLEPLKPEEVADLRDLLGFSKEARLNKYNIDELAKALRGEKTYYLNSDADVGLSGIINDANPHDCPSIAAGATYSFSRTVTGVDMGHLCIPSVAVDLQGMQLTAYVDSSNSVTFVLFNPTAGAIDLSNASFRVLAFPPSFSGSSTLDTAVSFTDGVLTKEA